MPYHLFESNTSVAPERATVSVLRAGRISLNQAAFTLIGKPAYVELLFDPEAKRIAIRPSDKRTIASYTVDGGKHTSTRYIYCRAFFDYFKVDLSSSRKYEAFLEGGTLIVDLFADSAKVSRGSRNESANPQAVQHENTAPRIQLPKAS